MKAEIMPCKWMSWPPSLCTDSLHGLGVSIQLYFAPPSPEDPCQRGLPIFHLSHLLHMPPALSMAWEIPCLAQDPSAPPLHLGVAPSVS